MIKYKAELKSKDLCVCIVDNTHTYSSWIKELVKNRADYTITNCTGMGYDVFVTKNIDHLLNNISNSYKTAVVISPGTEFIYGDSFFKHIPKKFNLIGHILDVGDSYYVLHEQCYILNLETFNSLGKPYVGSQEYFKEFTTVQPTRSKENIHDKYTPLWIDKGNKRVTYKNQGHGWNLIRSMIENDIKIETFNEDQRKNKNFLYNNTFALDWIYKRYNYCLTDHIYKENTGLDILPIPEGKVENLIIPASGKNWTNNIKKYGYKLNCKIKFYDYNSSSLEWIRIQTQDSKFNIEFEYHKIDILNQPRDFLKLIDLETNYIDFSNIFAYEATAALFPLRHRIEIQNFLIKEIAKVNPNCYIHFDQRAESGFVFNTYEINQSKDTKINCWNSINLPYWHY